MSKRILFVDDDRRFREVVLVFLRGRGFDIMQAGSLKEGELELNSCKFDLLIVDGELPDGDGVEFIKRARVQQPDVPIIFVSATWKDTESYKQLSAELGVSEILHKPVPPAVIADHIEKITGAVLISVKDEKVRHALDQLAGQYALELPDMILDLHRDLRLGLGNKDEKILLDASRKAHTIKGSAGSYGFHAITEAMTLVEELINELKLEPENQAIEKKLLAATGECKNVAEHIARTRGRTAKSDEIASAVHHMLLMAKDPAVTKLFESFVANRPDFALTICQNDEQLVQSAQFSVSELIFFEASERDLVEAGNTCKLIRAIPGYNDVPIVFVTSDDLQVDVDARCNYYGAVDVINRPLDPGKILKRINELVVTRRATFPKVVMFDDDKNFVRRVEMALNCEGLSVIGFTDTDDIDSVLDHAVPDLVLLDVEMPGVNGFEACRRIRKKSKLKNLPIVMVTARQDWETRLSAYESGADDCLSKPIVNAELVVKAKAWIDRSHRRSMRNDPLTGLLIHSVFAAEARQLMAAHPAVAFLMFSIKNLQKINQEWGAKQGDQALACLSGLLQKRFRTDAVHGRWGGSQLATVVRYSDRSSFEKSVRVFADEFEQQAKTAEYQPELFAGIAFADENRNIYTFAERAIKQPILQRAQ